VLGESFGRALGFEGVEWEGEWTCLGRSVGSGSGRRGCEDACWPASVRNCSTVVHSASGGEFVQGLVNTERGSVPQHGWHYRWPRVAIVPITRCNFRTDKVSVWWSVYAESQERHDDRFRLHRCLNGDLSL